mmetsp:Transcript_45813/g.143725  ORF Transcript_45813/g.143725 Transcript_45813/m.143725 type:complete len:642 (-) Transcript_45813:129-2054(-)
MKAATRVGMYSASSSLQRFRTCCLPSALRFFSVSWRGTLVLPPLASHPSTARKGWSPPARGMADNNPAVNSLADNSEAERDMQKFAKEVGGSTQEKPMRKKKGGAVEEVKVTLDEMKKLRSAGIRGFENVPPWVFTKEQLLQQEWKTRDEKRPKHLKERMEKISSGPKLDWTTFFQKRKVSMRGVNDLMIALNRRKDFKTTVSVFEKMGEQGLERDQHSYTTVLYACKGLGLLDKAMEIFETMRHSGQKMSSPAPYNQMIHILMKAGKLEQAMCIIDVLKADGLKPDKITYSNMLYAACYGNEYERPFQIVREMRDNSISLDQICYNNLLRACARFGAGWKALDLIDEMKEFKIKVDLISYNLAIKALCEGNLIDKAVDLYRWLLTNQELGIAGMMPDIQTNTIILQYYASLGDVEKAEAMFDNMVTQQGIKPDARCLLSLMNARTVKAYKSADLQERRTLMRDAKAIMQGMQTSLVLNQMDKRHMYQEYVKIACSTLEIDSVKSILEEMEREQLVPSGKTFSALLNMCECAGDGDHAIYFLSQMMVKGMKPCAAFHTRAAIALVRGNQIDRALKFLEKSYKEGVMVDECAEWLHLPKAVGTVWIPPDKFSGGDINDKLDFEENLQKLKEKYNKKGTAMKK